MYSIYARVYFSFYTRVYIYLKGALVGVPQMTIRNISDRKLRVAISFNPVACEASASPSFTCEACSMSRGDAPQKAVSTEPRLRRRFSKKRVANALAAARNLGMFVRGLKIATNGDIDIAFGKPAEDEAEDLRKLL